MDDQTRATLERIVRTGRTELCEVTFDGQGGVEARGVNEVASVDGNMRVTTLRLVAARLGKCP